MRRSQYRHRARAVQAQLVTTLQQHLRPADFSARCSAWQLLSSLVLAAACSLSLAAVALLRRASPSRETLRQAWLATLPDYLRLQQQLPGLLHASLPAGLRKHSHRRRYPLAIDLHVVPFYKRQRTPPAHVRKGRRVPGTAYSHQYATACLLRKGQYYTVALTPYCPDDDLASVVRRLLQQAARHGFAPRYLLMDRSFWAADVFRYLQRARYPFLIPVLARGKKATAPGGPTGTQRFFHRCPSGWYTYTVANRRKQKATLTVVVHRRNHGGRQGKRGRFAWAYGLWGVDLSTLQWVRESYRRRFRIESSYRLLEQARGRTSSRDEGLRLWYVLLGVLLANLWLQVRREIAQEGRRAGTPSACWAKRLWVVVGHLLLDLTAPPPSKTQLGQRL